MNNIVINNLKIEKIVSFELLQDLHNSKAGTIAKKRVGGFMFDYTNIFFKLDTLLGNPEYFRPIYKKEPFIFLLKGSTGHALLIFEDENIFTYTIKDSNIKNLNLNNIRKFINNGFDIGISVRTSAKRISIQGLGMIRRNELNKLIQQHDEYFKK